jgi:EAL and modified HD-GYP domain-containing signal transduction protein
MDDMNLNLNIFGSMWKKDTETDSTLPVLDPTAMSSSCQVAEAKAAPIHRFIGRQTILDRNKKVYGYELLFRSGWENCFRGDADEATRIMIADGALYGFHELTHGSPTFVNCTRESLVSGMVTLLPKSTVLEILETVVGDEEVLDACKRYKKMGYKLALDDFRMSEGMEGLVSLADYIKVDFRLSDAAERRSILSQFKGRNVILLAEKVETEEEFQTAQDEGFALFQGYFFCRPTVFRKKVLSANGANYLYLLSALSQGDFHVSQLAALLRSEVALSYQLLKLVNSAAYGANHEVRSLEDALMIVGELQFRKLVINAIATETCRGRSSELLVHVLHRARFLELMAPFTGENAAEQYLLGLLSLMDVMLDMPVAQLIDALPLRGEMKDALAGDANPVSIALKLFERYKEADWEFCMIQSALLNISETQLSDLYTESLAWAEKAVTVEQAKSRLPN